MFNQTHWESISEISKKETPHGVFYTAVFTPLTPCPFEWDPPTRMLLAFEWEGEILPRTEISVLENSPEGLRLWEEIFYP